MNNIVRAWKDEAYRQSLSVEEQAMLPTSPAGELELTDLELESVFGACGHRDDDPSIKTDQDVTQSAAASFGHHSIIINSTVDCSAGNSANVSATSGLFSGKLLQF
jgi:mersacidin/lichenicidin family type 2 lantibiotic